VTENTAAAARSATVTVSAGAFSHAVTVTQDGAPPVLDVAPATITAGSGAGSHSVTVTSNATWTVSVSAGATWCTVSPASAEGNGTVTVNVMENSTDATRSASVTFSAGTLTRTVEVEQASTPLDEPEPRTWIFGDSPLVWSDAIRIPACNKTSFTDSYSVPDCRSYTYEGNTWYYYNWTYVKMYASILCPSPWRLPDRWAFDELLLHADNVTLMQEWGYGGYIYDDGVWYTNEIGGYWSATQIDNFRAYHLLYSSVYAYNAEAMTNEGLQVRCVQ
jgi:hypothetical protein